MCLYPFFGVKVHPPHAFGLLKGRGWAGHLCCEGVGERKCGNYRSGFYCCSGWQFCSKNEMRKLDIFQVVSNVSLVADFY